MSNSNIEGRILHLLCESCQYLEINEYFNYLILEGLLIALDKQVHILMVDTAAFYTDNEHEIDVKMNDLRIRLNQERMALQNIQDYYNKKIDYDKTIKRLEKLYGYDILFVPAKEDIVEYYDRISALTKEIASLREKLKVEFLQRDGVRSMMTIILLP